MKLPKFKLYIGMVLYSLGLILLGLSGMDIKAWLSLQVCFVGLATMMGGGGDVLLAKIVKHFNNRLKRLENREN